MIGLLLLLLLAGCQAAPATPTAAVRIFGPAAPTATTVTTPAVALPRPSVAADVPRITAQELRRLQESGAGVIIVDDRSEDSYNAAHIAGAISIPGDQLSARYAELPKDRPVVLY